MPAVRELALPERSAEPTLPVAAVARRLGVAPATLRTWDRRYGLGPSRHTGGKHRRYGPADIVRLELMQRALLRGASTAEAARYALERMPKAEARETKAAKAALRIERQDGELVRSANGAARPVSAHATRPTVLAQPTEPAPGDGEFAAPRFARRLSGAALAMDARAVQQLLADVVAELGVLDAWENVIEPVVAAVGSGTGDGSGHSEVGYLLSECVFGALVRATPVLEAPRNLRPVLVGCVPDEVHTLPVYVVAAALAERRVMPQPFGVPLPADVLASVVRRSLPVAVVLWAQQVATADPQLFTRMTQGRQRGRLFACGPGWPAADLPQKVESLTDVRDVVERVEYVLVGGP